MDLWSGCSWPTKGECAYGGRSGVLLLLFSSYVGGESHYHLSRDISHLKIWSSFSLSLSLLFFLEVVVVTTVDFWISLHTFFLSPPLFLSFPLSALFSSSFFFLRILLPFQTVHPTLSLFLFFILLITFSPLTFYEKPPPLYF